MKNNQALLEWIAPLARETNTLMVYDLWVSRALIAERDGLDIELTKKRESQLLAACDMGLVLTQPYLNFYVDVFGIDPCKLAVVPHAVTSNWLTTKTASSPPDGTFIVAYWGNFLPQHGIELLLGAAQELRSHKDIVFRFYGTAWDRDVAKMLGQEGPNVQYFGTQSIKSLIANVDACHISVGHLLPVHDAHLVLPNKALEGMARSKPVIHIDADTLHPLYGFPDSPERCLEYFSGGIPGLVDAILKLKNTPELALRIGSNARQCVERHHSIQMTQTSLQVMLSRLGSSLTLPVGFSSAARH